MKTILVKWCGRPWLAATYVLGLVFLAPALLRWSGWDMPRRLLCLLAMLLPLRVWEENTAPGASACGDRGRRRSTVSAGDPPFLRERCAHNPSREGDDPNHEGGHCDRFL